jgi:hypothetical protein
MSFHEKCVCGLRSDPRTSTETSQPQRGSCRGGNNPSRSFDRANSARCAQGNQCSRHQTAQAVGHDLCNLFPMD